MWADQSEDRQSLEIYGQRLSADGLPLEAPWLIEPGGVHLYPQVAYGSAAETFVVIWNSYMLEGRRAPPAGDATEQLVLP